jgi:acyl-CoA dehydrogenase
MRAKYLTTAVRTGGKGLGGVSILCIETSIEGVGRRRQKTQGWNVSHTVRSAMLCVT